MNTPGPWTYSAEHNTITAPPTPHNGDGVIAAVRYLGNFPDRVAESTANGCLMAASLDCYEALKALYEFFENQQFYIRKFGGQMTNGDQDLIDAMFKKVDDALAKVEKA